MTSIEELYAQRAAIEKQISQALLEARAGAIAQIRDLMALNGLTFADISGSVTGKALRRKSDSTGIKIAPKFRDPVSGNQWSGRGRKPRWLVAAIAEGKSAQDFAV